MFKTLCLTKKKIINKLDKIANRSVNLTIDSTLLSAQITEINDIMKSDKNDKNIGFLT
jgi:hypothetical protein